MNSASKTSLQSPLTENLGAPLLGNVQLGYVLIDESGRILCASPKLTELLGRTFQDVAGQSIAGGLSREISLVSDDTISRSGAAQTHASDRKRLRWNLFPVSGIDGRPAYFVGVVQDENEIEKSERDLQHHNRLAALGSITAGLSHEITSPLTVISTTAELLLDSDDVVPTTRESLERIYEQAGRLTKLLRDFLRFVRNQRLTVKALHALEALEPAVAMCLHHPASKKVRLDVEAEPDLPFIAGDSDRLQQMFLNLLTNACCASPEGDCVTVAVRRAEVSLEGERPAVEYVIADHGPGIPQHDREHIFQPFFSTKARGEGTGLGLPIALRIVEAHGGQLRLASSLKRGTRAIVQLPIWRVEDDLALRPS